MAVTITVASATDPGQANVLTVSGMIAGDVITLQRSYGTTLQDIPGSWIANSSGTVSYSDYLYPLEQAVVYYVFNSTGDTLLATSAPSTPVPSMGFPWIRDLIFPALRYSAVTIVELTDRLRGGRVTPYYVTAQPYAVTTGDVRSGSQGTFQLLCRSHAERDAVLFAMSTGNPCGLRVPAACQVVLDDMLFTPVDITETRLGISGACLLTVDYVEVDLSEVATFQPVSYAIQSQNAAAAAILYGKLLPAPPTGLSKAFYGYTYADMYASPTGIAP